VADHISIDSADLRQHQDALETNGAHVVAAADDLRARMAGIRPAGSGGGDSEVINQKYYDSAMELLDATRSMGELLETLGADIGKFADASENQEAARTQALNG
jgi:hypothetical protein